MIVYFHRIFFLHDVFLLLQMFLNEIKTVSFSNTNIFLRLSTNSVLPIGSTGLIFIDFDIVDFIGSGKYLRRVPGILGLGFG